LQLPKSAQTKLDKGRKDMKISYIYIHIALLLSLLLSLLIVEGSLEVKLPTKWADEKQRREESERREE